MRAGPLGRWSLAAVLGAVNVGCGATRPIPPAPLAADPADPPPFTERWLARAGQGFVGPLSVGEGLLVGSGYDRRVVAVSLTTGKTEWEHRMAGGASAGVRAGGDTIFAASDRPAGEVVALERRHGHGVWTQRRTGRIAVPLLLTDSLVVAAPVEGGIIALRRRDGHIVWRHRIRPVVAAPLAGDSGRLLVTTGDSIFRLDAGDGTSRGGATSPVPVSAPWAAADSGIVVPGGDGTVAELRRRDLSVRWRDTLDSPVLIAPTVRGDTVWVATQAGSVYRILRTAPAPERLVHFPTPIAAPPVPWRDLLLVGMADGTLRALDASGAERWRIAAGNPLYTPPVPVPDGLIVLGGRGDIHRFVATR